MVPSHATIDGFISRCQAARRADPADVVGVVNYAASNSTQRMRTCCICLLPQVLGPEAATPGMDPSTLPLEPPRDNSPLSQRVCRVLRALRSRHTSSFAPAFVVRQGMPLEAHVVPLFVEDRSQGQAGYADFLQQLHNQVITNK
eukprot:GHRQ01022796.1.p2 GENE.GHRQ01022796.1~~GHRQ01022796.1.p2  ORF type:complete len:144 (-),score=40.89 GHRQ01022796.1:85-516(-)